MTMISATAQYFTRCQVLLKMLDVCLFFFVLLRKPTPSKTHYHHTTYSKGRKHVKNKVSCVLEGEKVFVIVSFWMCWSFLRLRGEQKKGGHSWGSSMSVECRMGVSRKWYFTALVYTMVLNFEQYNGKEWTYDVQASIHGNTSSDKKNK